MFETSESVIFSEQAKNKLLAQFHTADLDDKSRRSLLKSNLTQEETLAKLKSKGFEPIQKATPTEIFAETYQGNFKIPLDVTYRGMPCHLKVRTLSRKAAQDEINSPSKKPTQTSERDARSLLEEDTTIARISISMEFQDNEGKIKLLGYSDLTVYVDQEAQRVMVAGPVRPFDLGGSRITRPPGFANPNYTALAVRDDVMGAGIGSFLVEAGSLIASHTYYATERVFPSDSTDREAKGSFYVNQMGAKMEERTPYYSEDIKEMPVLSIGRHPNKTNLKPYLTEPKLDNTNRSTEIAELIQMVVD